MQNMGLFLAFKHPPYMTLGIEPQAQHQIGAALLEYEVIYQ